MIRRASLITTLLASLLALPAAPAGAQTMTVMVKMRDGIKLSTDVYLPKKTKGPWPVLMWRTPYNKKNLKAPASLYPPYGVAVVTQDMRGRYASQGVDRVFTTDGDGKLKDGHDTMAWLVSQKQHCNGLIATTGGSALGIVQYMQATAKPPGLKLLNAAVATPNMYQDAMFYGGVFRNSLVTGWLKKQNSSHFLTLIAAHPYEDAFWASSQTADQYGAVTAAGVHTGGWYDIFLQGNIDAFRGYQHQGGAGARGQQKLILGPWTHGGMAKQKQGELTYPANSKVGKIPFPNTTLVMLNHHLKLKLATVKLKPANIPAVQYYVMGDVTAPKAPGNKWRTAKDWPPAAAPVRLHLQPGGLLAEACPPASAAPTSYSAAPAKPTPTVCGGNLTIPAGPCDQSKKVEGRADVALFSTPKLQQPMEITGRVRAYLWVQIDRPDADLMVRLTDVYPSGKSMLIADGAARLAARGSTKGIKQIKAGEKVRAMVDLWSTSIIINKGHRLRAVVSSANFPRFASNRNNGKKYPQSVLGPGSKVKVSVLHQADAASYLELPDPTRAKGQITTCGGAQPDAGVSADLAAPGDTGPGAEAGAAPEAGGPADQGAGAEGGAQVDAGQPDGGGDGCSCAAGRAGAGGAQLPGLLLLGLLGLATAIVARRVSSPLPSAHVSKKRSAAQRAGGRAVGARARRV